MKESIGATHYLAALAMLVSMRKEAGLTQRQLANRLQREYSFVWRIEKGEKLLDVVEFFWGCRAFDQNPAKTYTRFTKQFAAAE